MLQGQASDCLEWCAVMWASFAAKPLSASYHNCTEWAGVMGGLYLNGSPLMPQQRFKLFTQVEAVIEQLELNSLAEHSEVNPGHAKLYIGGNSL